MLSINMVLKSIKNIEYSKYFANGTIYMEDVLDPFNVFRKIIYRKGAYVLHMLRFILGDELFFLVIKEYAADVRFRYKNVSTEDFQEVCERVSGEDLDYFFEQWIYDEYYPDYRYNYDQNKLTGVLSIVVKQIQENKNRRKVFKMPIEIKIEFTDGSDTTYNVFNDKKYQLFELTVSKEVSNVIIDPNNYVLKRCKFDKTLNYIIFDKEEVNLIIKPNPTDGNFSVDVPIKRLGEHVKIIVSSFSGKVVYNRNGIITSDNIKFNISANVKSGIYFVKFVFLQEQVVKKLVIFNNQ